MAMEAGHQPPHVPVQVPGRPQEGCCRCLLSVVDKALAARTFSRHSRHRCAKGDLQCRSQPLFVMLGPNDQSTPLRQPVSVLRNRPFLVPENEMFTSFIVELLSSAHAELSGITSQRYCRTPDT